MGGRMQRRRRVWPWIVIVILVIAAIKGSEQDKLTPRLASTEPARETIRVVTPRTARTLETAKSWFGKGETADSAGLQVTLTGVSESRGSRYNEADSGKVYVHPELLIVNNSDRSISVSSLSFDLYVDDTTVSYSLGAIVDYDCDQIGGTIDIENAQKV